MASSFKHSLDNAKRSFHRSFNSICGRVDRLASNEASNIATKIKMSFCMEACPLRKSQLKSLDFAVNIIIIITRLMTHVKVIHRVKNRK